MKDLNGRLVLQTGDVQMRWAEYSELLSILNVREPDILDVGGGARKPFQRARIVAAISHEEVQGKVSAGPY